MYRFLEHSEVSDLQITLPYFDPALPYARRQEICKLTYEFECTCTSCVSRPVKSAEDLSEDPQQLEALGLSLYSFVFPTIPLQLPNHQPLSTLPEDLWPVLHPNYLPKLSSKFRDASHDGPFDTALRLGIILLSLYTTVYPPNFPMIGKPLLLHCDDLLTSFTGLHSLELAKVTWNSFISITDISAQNQVEILSRAQLFLTWAQDVLTVLGAENGDASTPFDEIITLNNLLKNEMK